MGPKKPRFFIVYYFCLPTDEWFMNARKFGYDKGEWFLIRKDIKNGIIYDHIDYI